MGGAAFRPWSLGTQRVRRKALSSGGYMRIIGPPYYKPEVTCLIPPFPSEKMREERLKAEQEARLANARRKRESALRCPLCGDAMKIRLRRRWLCRHCLTEMAVRILA